MEEVGFEASIWKDQSAEGSGALHRSEARTWGRRLLLSALLTAPVAVLYMTLMMMPDLDRCVNTQ